MKDGWLNDAYWIVFDEAESRQISKAYQIQEYFPGFLVVALMNWDDFIVRNATGAFFRIPTVPMTEKYLEKLQDIVVPDNLTPDTRFTRKIKWYTKPIVFGGDPNSEENMIWVDMQQHQELVRWWNQKYREMTK